MNKYRVNAYLAVIIITIAGSLAAWVIVKVAYKNQYTIMQASPNTEASYAKLKDSILRGNSYGASQSAQ